MFRWLLLLLFPTLLLTACSKHAYESGSYGSAGYAADGDYGGYALEEASMDMAEGEAYYGDEAPPEPGEPASTPSAASQRMVFYSGYAQLRVARVESGIDAVRDAAEAAEGKVESIGPDYVVIRVPVARFQEVFDELLGMGDVLAKQVTADDVTDSFRAVSLRLQTDKATRARLQELLAKAETEEEQLQLLREIQRLTDQIDAAEAQARTLAQMAAMSRITISLVGRDALAWQGPEDDAAELSWIRQLSPFVTEVYVESGKVKLEVPEGMVGLDLKRRFVAESADGARIWTHKLLNEPAGDEAFWLDAVQERLGADFATAERVSVGGMAALRLVDRSDAPYSWIIGVRVVGKNLELVQVYYPSADQETRYADAVAAVLGGGAA